MGYVYLFECDGFYKIGHSEQPIGRLRRMQSMIPHSIHLVEIKETDKSKELENRLHKKFDEVRVNQTEWFDLTEEQAQNLSKKWEKENEKDINLTRLNKLDPSKLMNVKAVSKHLDISTVTLQKLIYNDELTAFKIGNKVKIRPEDLEEYIESSKINTED